MTKRKQLELSVLRQSASTPLLDDIRQLIVDTRVRVAAAVNAGLTLLYWQIGQRIRKDVLQEKRVGYREEILPTLSAQLVPVYQRSTPARFLRRNVPDRASATRIGYEISFTRYFYKPQPLRTLEEIRADIEALEQKDEGLLQQILLARIIHPSSSNS
jgi:hypothetical protein